MPEEKKNSGQMNLEELLALLKSEHGEDALTSNKNKPKPPVDEESSLDSFEFDDTPIEADYLNYNRIGVGVSAAVAERETDSEPEVETVVEPEVEAVVEPEVETVVEPEVETVVEPEVEAVVEPEVEAVVEPEVEAVVEPEVEVAVEPEEETVVEPEVETVVEPEVEAVVEPEEETVVEPEVEAVVEPEVEVLPWDEEPAAVETPDPIYQAIRKRYMQKRNLIEPEVEPIVDEVIEPEVEPIADEVVEPEVEPIVDEVIEPEVEPEISDEEGVPTCDVGEGYGVTKRQFEWTPKNRQKGGSTPIDEKTEDRFYDGRTVLPSRKHDKEFTANTQSDYIKKGYKASLKKEIRRLGVLFIITLIAFIVENLDLVGVTVFEPESNLILSLCLSFSIIVAALVLLRRELWDGTVLLFKGKAIPESFLLPMLLVPIVYYTVSLYLGTAPILLFGFAFAVLAVMAKLQTLLRLFREAKTFQIVSAEKPKRVLTVLPKEQAAKEAEAFSAYTSPDAEYYAIKRSLFVDGYFKMTNAIAKNKLVSVLYMALSLAAAALIFVISLTSSPWHTALAYALVSIYFTLPFSGFLLFELPLFRAAFSAADKQAAIIGEAAIEPYSDEGAVSFADSDLFSSDNIALCNILLFSESYVEKLLTYTALAFDEINSQVATVVKRSVPQYDFKDEITVLGAYDGGLEVKINKERVLLGSYAFMEENKILPPAGFGYEENGYSQLFVAVEGVMLGKLDFEYTLDRDCKGALDYLERAGYFIAIRTLDPNITYALLKKLLKYDISPIRLVKASDGVERMRMRKHSGGSIVSASKTKSLIGALVLAEKSADIQKIGLFFGFLSLFIGSLVVLLSVKLASDVLLSGIGVVLFQLFWFLPILLLTVLFVRGIRSKKKK